MFAPRAFMNENAMVSQTPGPTRGRSGALSPHKGNLTTAKKHRRFDGTDDENGLASPKKLFGGAKSPMKGGATPGPSRRGIKGSPIKGTSSNFRSALGDKTNNNKTPSARNALFQRPPPDDGSPSKKSPTKGKKRAEPATPAQTLHKSLKPSAFRTPVANIGQMGAMKARMGEMMDAQRLASAGPASIEPEPEQEVRHWTDGLTEDEIYPDIEYMPPSHLTHEQVHDPPPQLEGMIHPAELAQRMSRPNFISAWSLGSEDDGLAFSQPTDAELEARCADLLHKAPTTGDRKPKQGMSTSQNPTKTVSSRPTTSMPKLGHSTATASIRKAAPAARNGSQVAGAQDRSGSKSSTSSSLRSTHSSTTSASRRPLSSVTASSLSKSTGPRSMAISAAARLSQPSPTTRPLTGPTASRPLRPSGRPTTSTSKTSSSSDIHPVLHNIGKDELELLIEKQLSLMGDSLGLDD